MTTLVHAALTFRRSVRASHGFVAVAVFALLLVLGVFRVDSLEALRVEHAAVGGAWLALLAMRLRVRTTREDVSPWIDLELGLLLLVGGHAAVQVLGGLGGEVYPVVYIVVAFVASFARHPMGMVVVAAAVGLEALLWFTAEPAPDLESFGLHAGFVVCFGLLKLVFTRAEIARVRERSRRELDEEKEKVRTETRMFRLVAAPSAEAPKDDDRLFRSSVEELHQHLYYVLQLLHRTLELHTCVLLMKDDAGRLRIVELVTASDDIAEGPFTGGEGVVGAVLKRQLPMNLRNLKPGYKGLCYYRGPALVQAFLGVPIVEEGGSEVLGVLCADRVADRPFTEKEEAILQDSLTHVLRALENERVFVALERTKREQTILHRASQMLGAAMGENDVIDAGLNAAEEIASFDFAAITLYDADDRRHRVRRAVGIGAEKVSGLTFRDNTSLTAMAVKNRHYLPYRGHFDPRQQTVFTKRASFKGMRSLLILPLIVREDAVGTLVLAAERDGAFHEGVRPTLQALANQLAVSLSNAQAVQRLEEMATTDGLTGCLNKRAFLEELDRKLRSAARFGRPLSLLVTDIDHFKSVNDTYGHATGDVVIKELGAILRRVKRETDIVARFGGEEFCVLCEETDTEGAVLLAERIREELGATVFHSDIGELSVTASLGVATFPEHAEDSEGLFKITDDALYVAKRNGRNQVRTPT